MLLDALRQVHALLPNNEVAEPRIIDTFATRGSNSHTPRQSRLFENGGESLWRYAILDGLELQAMSQTLRSGDAWLWPASA